MAQQPRLDSTLILTPYCAICGAARPHRPLDHADAERQVELHAQWKIEMEPLYNPVTGRPLAESPFTATQREYLMTFMEGKRERQQNG